MVKIELNGEIQTFDSMESLKSFLFKKNLQIEEDGTIVQYDDRGIVPEILDKWFKERVEYKDKMKQYANEGNEELEEFYSRRQHIQKIFLNSMYGYLGLPVSRFFDIDNAVAVTATGQEVIKESANFVNNLYKELGAKPHDDATIQKYNLILREEASKKKEKFIPAGYYRPGVEIELESGKIITVTSDDNVVVSRDNEEININYQDLVESDELIKVNDTYI